MTEQEQKVLDISGELWKAFLELPVIHPDDRSEFKFLLHQLQNQILARPLVGKV